MSDLSDDLLGDYDLDELGAPARDHDCRPCGECEGTGRKPTTLQGSTTTQWHSVRCPDCNGSGKDKP